MNHSSSFRLMQLSHRTDMCGVVPKFTASTSDLPSHPPPFTYNLHLLRSVQSKLLGKQNVGVERQRWAVRGTSRTAFRPSSCSNSSRDSCRPCMMSVTVPDAGDAGSSGDAIPSSPSNTYSWPVLRSLIVYLCMAAQRVEYSLHLELEQASYCSYCCHKARVAWRGRSECVWVCAPAHKAVMAHWLAGTDRWTDRQLAMPVWFLGARGLWTQKGLGHCVQ